MQIGSDDLRLRLVKLFKICNDAAERVVCLFGLQIADVLADENLRTDGKCDSVF